MISDHRELRHLFLFNDALVCTTRLESQAGLTKVGPRAMVARRACAPRCPWRGLY